MGKMGIMMPFQELTGYRVDEPAQKLAEGHCQHCSWCIFVSQTMGPVPVLSLPLPLLQPPQKFFRAGTLSIHPPFPLPGMLFPDPCNR